MTLDLTSLRQRRTPLRTLFTKAANALEEALGLSDVDVERVASLLDQLESKGEKLASLDERILQELQNSEYEPEELCREIESAEEYRDRLIDVKCRTKRLLTRLDSTPRLQGTVGENPMQRKYRLPEIELKKFSGDLREWLGFWGQFKKIDEDINIAPEDKFQYLVQATVEKSKAREIVVGFPPTAENYEKAIKHLKGRFGREEMLVEVYVRDLLCIVLNNVSSTKRRAPLSSLYDKIETQLRALETLGVTSEKCTAMLYPLVESCLPEDILLAWERSRGFHDVSELNMSGDLNVPNRLSLLMNFLRNEVGGEERISLARSGFGLGSDNPKKPTSKGGKDESHENIPTAAELLGTSQSSGKKIVPNCVFCGKDHPSAECKQVKKMSLEQRRRILVNEKRCFLCLKKGHLARVCYKNTRCPNCQDRHCALLCPQGQRYGKRESYPTDDNVTRAPTEHSLANQACTSEVKLQTLQVFLRGRGKTLKVRALLDSGSQRSYITEQVVKEMGYEVLDKEILVHNLFGGQQSSQQTHRKYRIHVSDLEWKYHCSFEVLDQPRICRNIPRIQRGSWTRELVKRGINLSDVDNSKLSQKPDEEIQILIGADVVGKLLTGRMYQLECGAMAIETRLGWTVMGKTITPSCQNKGSQSVISLHVDNIKLSDLWNLESIGITDPVETKTKEEMQEAAIQHFNQTVEFDTQGRYRVCLPWIEGRPTLPTGLEVAQRRLQATVRKLKREENLEDYKRVIVDWLAKGIIEVVSDDNGDSRVHYLPHRAVVKESSMTTKIRPVFDASAHVKGCPSLNDCLEKGPNLMERISTILNRFRFRAYGVTADIRQAFLQIDVHVKDRDYLRFLWIADDDPDSVKVYRHCRLVFGLTCSPFLLGATISYHLERAPERLRRTAETLQQSFYVDNCVTSLNSTEELYNFIQESRELMTTAGFDLRGWCHSHPEEYDNIPEGKYEPVLGLLWDAKEDTLQCDLKALNNREGFKVSKRVVLAEMNHVFDPIGFTCPITLFPKLLLQKCCRLNLSWDQDLPEDMRQEFERWKSQLWMLDFVKIPRWIFQQSCRMEDFTLHVFCDASRLAYAACVYLRATKCQDVSCRLVQAKARVGPLKEITIPRLELLACCIGARLADKVKGDLQIKEVETWYWTDSTNALCWIKRDEQWAVFVKNRTREIRTLTKPEAWRHVTGTRNPADLPSRGCSVKHLVEGRWWEGPTWLSLPPDKWPSSEPIPNEEEINQEKQRRVVTAANIETLRLWDWNKFSSYTRLLRVCAWIRRFISNTRKTTEEREVHDLQAHEIQSAEKVLFIMVQRETFDGIQSESIRNLRPLVCSDGLIRLETRIVSRDDTAAFRRPILLPARHPLTVLLIQNEHKKSSHAGIQFLMARLRERYWILRCRRTIRAAISTCVTCRRFRMKGINVETAPLPVDRIREATIFEVTGVDLAGPLYMRGGQKSWIVLFTCAVFRAVHLELVTSLSTEAFMLSLRRFIARRGRPKIMYSDNGSNFVGTVNAMSEQDWNQIRTSTSMEQIQWRFNPPTASWWGGWWERLVRMVKELLRRVLGRASLSFEELSSVLCEIEATLNSRPLTYLSEDADDLAPLSPALFLQEITEVGVPELDSLDHAGLNRRATYRGRLRDQLKARFRIEYLGQLRNPPTTKGSETPLMEGQVVLVGSDDKKRLDWVLGRILKLHQGKDGHVRVALIRTSKGEMLRPVQRLFPLEVSESEGEPLRKKTSSAVEVPNRRHESWNEDDNEPIVTRRGRKVIAPDRLTYA